MRILITADFHVGLTTHSVQDINGVNSRFIEMKGLLRQIKNIAVERCVDYLVIAGDIFHHNKPDINSLKLFYEFLYSFRNTNIKIFIIVGNHDYNARLGKDHSLGLYRIIEGIDNVRIYDDAHYLIENKQLLFVFHPYGSEFKFEEALQIAYSRNYISILVCHAHLNGATVGAEPFEINTPDLFNYDTLPFDVIIAGHFHKPQVLSNKPLTFYPGSIQQIDFNECNDQKCVVLLDIKSNNNINFEWIPLQHTYLYQIDLTYPEKINAEQLEYSNGKIVKVVVHVPEQHILVYDENDIRNELLKAGAFIVSVEFDVLRDLKTRDAEIKFDINVLRNFEKYLLLKKYEHNLHKKIYDEGKKIVSEIFGS